MCPSLGFLSPVEISGWFGAAAQLQKELVVCEEHRLRVPAVSIMSEL